MNVITKTLQLADGRTITIETGKVAKQADGSVMLRMNNTVLLATVCAAKDAVPGTDFMPLQVDYREQYAAAGRFPGGFTKREGKASDNEILTSRLVDRVLRPLFPSNYHAERLTALTSPMLWPALPLRQLWPARISPSSAPSRRSAWLASTASTSLTPPSLR